MKPIPSVKFALYVRGSTEEQQNTLAAQADTMRKYAAYKNAETLDAFVDSGVSGSTPFFERPAVGTMLAAMQRDGVKDIVFAKFDRAFRDPVDAILTCQQLQQQGVTMHFLDLNVDTSTEMGEFFMTVMAAMGKFENRRRKTRVKEGNAVARQNGQNLGNLPYGWNDPNPAGTPKHLRRPFVVNPAQQRVLARLAHGDLSTLTLREAQRRLNAGGIPSPGAGRKFRREDKATGKITEWTSDGQWNVSSVQSVKKNPRLAEGFQAPAQHALAA